MGINLMFTIIVGNVVALVKQAVGFHRRVHKAPPSPSWLRPGTEACQSDDLFYSPEKNAEDRRWKKVNRLCASNVD